MTNTTTATKSDVTVPASGSLRQHFDRATVLLEQMADLRSDIKRWRDQARNDGLNPRAIIKLAKEHLRDAAQRRKDAERAEVEDEYRRSLGPLFDWAGAQ